MQAVLERCGFETYDRGLVLRNRSFLIPEGRFLGDSMPQDRYDAAARW